MAYAVSPRINSTQYSYDLQGILSAGVPDSFPGMEQEERMVVSDSAGGPTFLMEGMK